MPCLGLALRQTSRVVVHVSSASESKISRILLGARTGGSKNSLQIGELGIFHEDELSIQGHCLMQYQLLDSHDCFLYLKSARVDIKVCFSVTESTIHKMRMNVLTKTVPRLCRCICLLLDGGKKES